MREAEPPTDEAIAEAIAQLTGSIEQVPPAYSAKRVAGRRAYEAARAGEALVLAPAHVQVFAWRDVARDGDRLRATIACGGGTYIRALARDLGRLTGSAAHLAELRRVRSGPFHVSDAASLDVVRAGEAPLRPALDALPTIPHVTLVGRRRRARAARHARRAQSGRRRAPRSSTAAAARSSPSPKPMGARWQPRVVMRKVG